MRIAYLGPRGTFTEEALLSLLSQIEEVNRHNGQPMNSSDIQLIPKETIPDCLVAASEQKDVQYALIPIENSIEGSVNMTLDWIIHEVQIPIQAEITLPIQQAALVHPARQELELEQIEKVFSHPHAIAQCHSFLRKHCPNSEWVYMKSTAEAVGHVSRHPEEKWLAIGTSLAAKYYQLTVKAERIQDYENNHTRFVLVGEQELINQESFANWVQAEQQKNMEHENEQAQVLSPVPNYKTSLLITLPQDFPGALYQVLAAFSWRRLNLTRIESRPTKKALGSYVFLIDLEHPQDNVLLPGAISEVEALGCQIRVLGSFPCFFSK